jgi:hypothetical protein
MMHVGEWAILLGLVVTAFLTVQVYLRRALQARVIAASDAFTQIRANFNASSGGVSLNANFAGFNQQEPYYHESFYETYQEQVQREHLGGGAVAVEKVADVTARAANGYQIQRGARANRNLRDNLWQ